MWNRIEEGQESEVPALFLWGLGCKVLLSRECSLFFHLPVLSLPGPCHPHPPTAPLPPAGFGWGRAEGKYWVFLQAKMFGLLEGYILPLPFKALGIHNLVFYKETNICLDWQELGVLKPWECLAQDGFVVAGSSHPAPSPSFLSACPFISRVLLNATDERGLIALAESSLSRPGFLHVGE